MLRKRDFLAILVVIGLALFSFYGALSYYPPEAGLKRIRGSSSLPEEKYLRQLNCVRQELAPGEVVGFVTSYQGDDFDRFYRLTQYGLVPVVVDDLPAHRLLVGYFPGSEAWQEAEIELSIVKDCPAGFLLLQNEDWE